MISPHAHADLHHVFLLETGGGRVDADGQSFACAAPCVVVVSAGVVHAFQWEPEATGRVLTFSDVFMRTLTSEEQRASAAFLGGAWTAAVGNSLTHVFGRLERELGWAAPGHDLAIAANLSLVLVEILRLHHQVNQEALAPPGPQALLVARYRQLLEAKFRDHPSASEAAVELGVSTSRLRAACSAVAGASPTQMMHDRLRLEAERLMRYSKMNVAQVAHYLGFQDPAYFSRFFVRESGKTPREFRLVKTSQNFGAV